MTTATYKALFRNSVRSYFAPLMAIFHAIKMELRRAERDHAKS